MRVLLCLLLTGCGLPTLSSEDVFGLEAAPRAWVYGTVVSSISGTPVADATVQLAGASSRTDVNGAFRIEGLTTMDGQISVSRAGFQALTQPLTLHAGGNLLELRLLPVACGGCLQDEVCDTKAGKCVQAASVSGDLVDACTHVAIAARVTIDGKSTCSISGKGYWQLKGLTPGGPQTLAAGREGYQPFSRQLTLVSGFNALDKIELTPTGGCTGPAPAPSVCSCTGVNCQ